MNRISLDGIWKCKSAGGYRGGEGDWPRLQRWMPEYDMKVPGTVQEALQHLTGDVHYAHNVLNARWIEEETWLISRTFCLSEEDLANDKRVRLVFEGLDLYALIFVNGRPVGRHGNFFVPCRLDVTDFVRPGDRSTSNWKAVFWPTPSSRPAADTAIKESRRCDATTAAVLSLPLNGIGRRAFSTWEFFVPATWKSATCSLTKCRYFTA